MSSSTQINIKDSILHSISLSKEQKEEWLLYLPQLNDEQIAGLSQIFLYEQEECKNILQKAEDQKVEIRKKYLVQLEQYKKDKMREILKMAEEKEEEEDMEAAESLLQKLGT